MQRNAIARLIVIGVAYLVSLGLSWGLVGQAPTLLHLRAALLTTTTPTASLIPTVTLESVSTAKTRYWVPPLKVSWQWQLSIDEGQTGIDVTIPADVYDIDAFDNSAEDVTKLKSLRLGRRVICYISAGSWEDWRPDAAAFPDSVKGNTLDGWPNEKWLDVRQTEILIPLMRARMQMCKDKGFDAVEPDNLDAYSNDSGFPLNFIDQVNYLRLLSAEAHALGLSIGLKNAGAIAKEVSPYFDWALNEQCYQYNECDYLTTYFVNKGKAAFVVEYTVPKSVWCPQALKAGYNGLQKPDNYIVTSAWDPCR